MPNIAPPTGESRIEAYVRSQGGARCITHLLVANNGLAAAKGIRSLRHWLYSRLGDDRAVRITAMATPEDLAANAEYLRLADRIVSVPGGRNCHNYANVRLVVGLAESEGVQAVWAGWGHASENPQLPTMLQARNILFLGPSGTAMHALGDKIASTLIAQSAGVPVLPWSGDGLLLAKHTATVPEAVYARACVHSVAEAGREADRIGFPAMLKASAGGGGKGIRLLHSPADLAQAYAQVQLEVPDSPVFLMQVATDVRHLEIQVVADEYGTVRTLYGRDCSVQRRHQKIIEEAPALAAPEDVQRAMETAAVRLAQSVGYVGVGTVEFLYHAESRQFYFLELNPRLQVEHPTTERVTGLNLPALQLQIAMGIPLANILPATVAREGHVIAARITAEDGEGGFRPTGGRVGQICLQSSPAVWGYFAMGAGGRLHEHADSQLGHLFAHGPTREDARQALVLALKELSVQGEISTAVEYLAALLEHPDFVANRLTTRWLEDLLARGFRPPSPDPLTVVAVAGLVHGIAWEQQRVAHIRSVLGRKHLPEGSRLRPSCHCTFIYRELEYRLQVRVEGHDRFHLALNDSRLALDAQSLPDGAILATIQGRLHTIYAQAEEGADVHDLVRATTIRLTINNRTVRVSRENDPTKVKAPSPGRLVRWLVAEGALVEAGQAVAELEIMKMCMVLRAGHAGHIAFKAALGQAVVVGQVVAALRVCEGRARKTVPVATEARFAADPPPPLPDRSEARAAVERLWQGWMVPNERQAVAAFFESLPLEEADATIAGHLHRLRSVEEAFGRPVVEEVILALAQTDDHLLGCLQLHERMAELAGLVVLYIQSVPPSVLAGGLKTRRELRRIGRMEGHRDIARAAGQVLCGGLRAAGTDPFSPPSEPGPATAARLELGRLAAHHAIALVHHQDDIFVWEAVEKGNARHRRLFLRSASASLGACLDAIECAVLRDGLQPAHHLFLAAGHDMSVEEHAVRLRALNIRQVEARRGHGYDLHDFETQAVLCHSRAETAPPYPVLTALQLKRYRAQALQALYPYDLPVLLARLCPSIVCQELDCIEGQLVPVDRAPGLNCTAVVVFLVSMAADALQFIVIANDMSVEVGALGMPEDELFALASQYARERSLARVYIAANSGARIGLADAVRDRMRVELAADGSLDGLYLDEPMEGVACDGRGRIRGIVGPLGIGVENLQGSALVARETALAYESILTLTLVLGRSVGIGAYLVRLGQRVIQRMDAPIVLTGVQALNEVLGRPVYASNVQIGGPAVMAANGVTHRTCWDDLGGLQDMLTWVQLQRDRPFDGRLDAIGWSDDARERIAALFDPDSFFETQAGWARTAIAGRARLAGMAVAVLSSDASTVTKTVAVDPANPDSAPLTIQQAGAVWHPDSAAKSAQLIRDAARERLPLIILAHWRGFAGGQRDLSEEILRWGSEIVAALAHYPEDRPVIVYLAGELRGGAWVVLDRLINGEAVECWATEEARGSIMEPAGMVAIKFRPAQREKMAERLGLPRDEALLGQIAARFADLHDGVHRLQAIGAIRGVIPWAEARERLATRLRRRKLEEQAMAVGTREDPVLRGVALSRAGVRAILDRFADGPAASRVPLWKHVPAGRWVDADDERAIAALGGHGAVIEAEILAQRGQRRAALLAELVQ